MTDTDSAPGGPDRVDAALRAHFSAVPRPALSPLFAERCARRATAPAGAVPLSRRQRLALRVYWGSAAVLSLALLLRADWPAGLGAGATAALVAIAFLVALPVFLLARLRGGLFAFALRVLG